MPGQIMNHFCKPALRQFCKQGGCVSCLVYLRKYSTTRTRHTRLQTVLGHLVEGLRNLRVEPLRQVLHRVVAVLVWPLCEVLNYSQFCSALQLGVLKNFSS